MEQFLASEVGQTKPMARKVRLTCLALVPASMILANCAELQGLQGLLDEQAITQAGRTPPMLAEVPAMAMEQPAAPPVMEAPAVAAPEQPRVVSNMPGPRMPGNARRAAPRPPALMPADLVGFDFVSVLRILKKPDAVQTNALFVLWTYTRPSCTLQLYFYPEIQTKVFRLLKTDLKSETGARLASPGNCMRDMLVAGSDDPPAA
jgi:hypothetical protein